MDQQDVTADNLQPPKRGRGRPKTGTAMSPAEKQRAYRERLNARAAAVNGIAESEIARLKQELEKAKGEKQQLVTKVTQLQAKATRPASERRWVVQMRPDQKGSRWKSLTLRYDTEKKAHEAMLDLKPMPDWIFRVAKV